MTMPVERTRAPLLAGGFLIELARDKRLPVNVRRTAVIIARHFRPSKTLRSWPRFGTSPVGSVLGWQLPRKHPIGPTTASSGHSAIRRASNCLIEYTRAVMESILRSRRGGRVRTTPSSQGALIGCRRPKRNL